MSLGDAIQKAAGEVGIRLVDLVKRCPQLNPTTVERLWRGQTVNPDDATVEIVANAIGMTGLALRAMAHGYVLPATVQTVVVANPEEIRLRLVSLLNQAYEQERTHPAQLVAMEKWLEEIVRGQRRRKKQRRPSEGA